MRAVFTVEVDDGFLEARSLEMAARSDLPAEGGGSYFRGLCEDIADDELACAFFG